MAQLTVISKGLYNEVHLSYKSLSTRDWKHIIIVIVISSIIALLTILILKQLGKLSTCRLTGIFIIIFFLSMLLFGDEYLKNVAIISLVGILLTIILSVFVFLTYDTFACKDFTGPQEEDL